jgi:hypothetical protein
VNPAFTVLISAMLNSIVKNLETTKHRRPSTISTDTIHLSGGDIPEVFLTHFSSTCVPSLATLLTIIHVLPEILELPVPSPIVIVGLPRTGTTHLHNIVSRDSRLRSLPYLESLQPVLPSEKQPPSGQPDSYTFDVTATQPSTTLPLSETLQASTVTSVFAIGLFNGIPKMQLVSAQVNGTPGLPLTGSNPYAQPTNSRPSIPWPLGVLALMLIGAGVTSIGTDIARKITRVRSHT